MADEELTANQDSSGTPVESGDKPTSSEKVKSESTAALAEASTAEAVAGTTEVSAATKEAVGAITESVGSIEAATESAPEAAAPPDEASAPQLSEPLQSSPEILDAELESIRPLPPSLRLKTAQDSTSRPMNVRTTLPSANWPPKVVADLMTRKIITVEEHETVSHLEEWMQRFKFHHLPVVDSNMKLIGLISRTDFLHAELGRKPDGSDTVEFGENTQAGDIMRRNVVIARLDSPLSTACKVMIEKNLACLPVVLDDGTLVGIVTKFDFVRLSLTLLESLKSPR